MIPVAASPSPTARVRRTSAYLAVALISDARSTSLPPPRVGGQATKVEGAKGIGPGSDQSLAPKESGRHIRAQSPPRHARGGLGTRDLCFGDPPTVRAPRPAHHPGQPARPALIGLAGQARTVSSGSPWCQLTMKPWSQSTRIVLAPDVPVPKAEQLDICDRHGRRRLGLTRGDLAPRTSRQQPRCQISAFARAAH